MGTAMSNIFRLVEPALSTIDTVIARAILLFWVSTLQQQRRHRREPQH